MGPLFFRAENRLSRLRFLPSSGGFNGAALFQSGERPAWTNSTCPPCPLQWGRSFSERRTTGVASRWYGRHALQWGRSFSERRTRRQQLGRGQHLAASMGPLFFRAENLRASAQSGARWSSFNGAALFQSGEPRPPAQHSRATIPVASMGPLFFRAENVYRPGWDHPERVLQWGRSFSERRTPCAHAIVRNAVDCFNGAALFQSGEPNADIDATDAMQELQWGRSFSERRTDG